MVESPGLYHCTDVDPQTIDILEGKVPTMECYDDGLVGKYRGVFFSASSLYFEKNYPGMTVYPLNSQQKNSYRVKIDDLDNFSNHKLFYIRSNSIESSYQHLLMLVPPCHQDQFQFKFKQLDLGNNRFFCIKNGKAFSLVYHPHMVNIFILGDVEFDKNKCDSVVHIKPPTTSTTSTSKTSTPTTPIEPPL